jgi:hypothetical protein
MAENNAFFNSLKYHIKIRTSALQKLISGVSPYFTITEAILKSPLSRGAWKNGDIFLGLHTHRLSLQSGHCIEDILHQMSVMSTKWH